MMINFAMFTESGNAAVAKIVECAETAELPWSTVDRMLTALATHPLYSEATDTAVREAVYYTLGFDKA
jgi:DNA-binding IclR family transcriptional regulator